MTDSVVSKPKFAVIGAVRSLLHLIAVISITAWGFVSWALPLPGIVFGFIALIVTVLLWALFLSPKPVLRADRFAQSMIELLLLAGAVGALISLGAPWFLAAVYGVAGAIIGYFAGLPENS